DRAKPRRVDATVGMESGSASGADSGAADSSGGAALSSGNNDDDETRPSRARPHTTGSAGNTLTTPIAVPGSDKHQFEPHPSKRSSATYNATLPKTGGGASGDVVIDDSTDGGGHGRHGRRRRESSSSDSRSAHDPTSGDHTDAAGSDVGPTDAASR